MLVIRTNSLDSYHNLAIEELCLEQVGPGCQILFLWQSADTVVIGKNQNPWLECSLIAMEQGGAKLARRLSGGGTVFHDTGNLNYAFLLPRREYDSRTIFNIVIKALKHFGVWASVLGKNSLAVNGQKVSGNAFCYRHDNVLHHGTLLISTDLCKLNRYLTPTNCPIRTRAIRSHPASVANLQDLKPSITVSQMTIALAETAAAEWRQQIRWGGHEMFDPQALEIIERKYASWLWQFGMTPPFEVEKSSRFNWGKAWVRLSIEKAMIRQSQVGLGGIYQRFAPVINQVLVGTLFSEHDILHRLQNQVPEFQKNDAEKFARWLVGF